MTWNPITPLAELSVFPQFPWPSGGTHMCNTHSVILGIASYSVRGNKQS